MFREVCTNEMESGSFEFSTKGLLSIGTAIGILAALLIAMLFETEKLTPELAQMALENLKNSGVQNPVTAVLLNYRSYDTLLEIAVLLIVACVVLPKCEFEKNEFFSNNLSYIDPVLLGLLKWLVPIAIMLSAYLLWIGAYAPGGAFQAGAVLAGAGVVLSLTGRHSFTWEAKRVKTLLTVGLFVFIGVAVYSAAVSGTLLQYPLKQAGILILLVEIAATVSIATTLLLLFDLLRPSSTSGVRSS